MTRLSDKTVVVTGATGIAAAAARRFLEEGAAVFTISLSPEECVVLQEDLPAGSAHDWEAADLTLEGEAERSFAAAVDRFGRLDGVFAVAGGSGRRFGDGPVADVSLDAWQATLELNLTTTFLTVREAIRAMLAQRPAGGSIVVTSSVLASHPSPHHFATHAYATAKGAQAALVRAAAAHYAGQGIRVNAVQPGLVRTPMSNRAQQDDDINRYMKDKQPLTGGIIEPSAVAAAAAFLLSPDAASTTGQTLLVDAGWSLT